MRMINALIPNNNNTELHTVAKGIGAEVGFGYVAADEYGHEASKAQHGDKFIGLPMDMDNEGDKKNDRIGRWVSQLATEGFYAGGGGGGGGGAAEEPLAAAAAAEPPAAEPPAVLAAETVSTGEAPVPAAEEEARKLSPAMVEELVKVLGSGGSIGGADLSSCLAELP